jgi:hypothetical protein
VIIGLALCQQVASAFHLVSMQPVKLYLSALGFASCNFSETGRLAWPLGCLWNFNQIKSKTVRPFA